MLQKLWRLSIIISILMLLLPLALWLLLRGSLPQLEGEISLPGLSASVSIERDIKGTVTIDAANELDMARALGFVHAQERFFEMDLMRRRAAGELAELFGKAALEHDIKMRKHRLRNRTHQHLEIALGDKQNMAESYKEGVNAGLAALTVRPWPYLLLRQKPRHWELEDTILVGLAMYADLQDTENSQELALARIREVIPENLYTLITHDGSQWDAPLFGAERGNALLPTVDQLNLRQLNIHSSDNELIIPDNNAIVGSNHFAVSGMLTNDSRAIVADDMHLSLRVPNIWFRARLRYKDTAAPETKVDINGFTLPGIPAMIVGSNTHVAWGFTNSYIDTADFVRLPENIEIDNSLSNYQETIYIAGQAHYILPIQETEWGPLWHEKERLALRWAAHLPPGAINLNLADMATAKNIEEAFSVANKAGLPVQNLLVADSSGRIAWRLIGGRPERNEHCLSFGIIDLQDTANHVCLPWSLVLDQAPVLIDPPSQRLWTANARVLDNDALKTVGNGGYDLGARAQQIRDGLFSKYQFNETDFLAIQLDDRAVLMQRWWQLLRDTVTNSSEPELQTLETLSRRWDGRASIDSVSYHLARDFREITLNTLKTSLLAPAKQALNQDFIMPRLAQFEGVAWPLLEQKPAHLLPQPFKTWDELLKQSAQQLANNLKDDDLTWGKRNTTAICHPLMRALPDATRPWLCMPPDPLPGDHNVPRMQSPNLGASQRMVVAPGHEIDGIIHMPGGQSGHFMSPFWGNGHHDWVQGKPTPFLPSETQYQMILNPTL